MCYWWECKMVQLPLKTVWQFFKKLSKGLSYDPAVPLLDGEMKAYLLNNRKTGFFPCSHDVGGRWWQDRPGLLLAWGRPPSCWERPMLRPLPVSWAPTGCSSAQQRQGSHISVCVQSLSVIINWLLPTLILLRRLSKGDHCYSRQLRCGEAWSISGPCLWPWLHGGDAGSSQVRRLMLIRQSKGLKRTLSVTEVATSESSYHLCNWMMGMRPGLLRCGNREE